ncbi:hypothetical protein HDU92_007379 [Lobulomyces angularis]|nr:hypothetical protein HDU92_007379 [Lobulomyces angularis]
MPDTTAASLKLLIPTSNDIKKYYVSFVDSQTEDHKKGICFDISRVKHSCLANSLPCIINQNYGALVASRKIDKGEEITISYVKGTLEERRKLLFSNYGFQCECNGCVENSEEWALLEELESINKTLREDAFMKNPMELIELLKKSLDLLKILNQSNFFLSKTFSLIFLWDCCLKKKMNNQSLTFLKSSIELMEGFYGFQSEMVIKLKELENIPEGTGVAEIINKFKSFM